MFIFAIINVTDIDRQFTYYFALRSRTWTSWPV